MDYAADKCPRGCGEPRMRSRAIANSPLSKHTYRCGTVDIWHDHAQLFENGDVDVTVPPINKSIEIRTSNACYERLIRQADERTVMVQKSLDKYRHQERLEQAVEILEQTQEEQG